MNISKKDPIFSLFILLTIVLAVFFRIYNYLGRVNVHADNAWEIQVARYALDNLKIPQIGPFSSAGPFFYGPWYFWIFAILSIIPLGFLTHWYLMTLLSLVFVYLMFWIGREVGGKWVGALAALFASISTAEIDNSFGVWSPSLIPILVAVSLVLLLRFSKKRKLLDLFLLSFVIGLSITIHFQSVLISPILFAAIVLSFPRRRESRTGFSIKSRMTRFGKYMSIVFIGFIIPFLPLVWWDAHHNWYNLISLMVYLLIDQYKIWVPNRWLTYIGSYWPQTWAEIVGGSKYLGAVVIGLVTLFGVLRLKNFKRYKAFYLVALTFLFEIILFRYYRGERFYYYSLFAHPAVIVLSAFVVYELFKINKYLGLVLGVLIVVMTLKISISHLRSGQVTIAEVNTVRDQIYNSNPSGNFDVWGCNYNGGRVSHPLALSMYIDGRNTLDGIKIGACEAPDGSIEWHKLAPEEYTGENPAFYNVTTEHVYRGLEQWWLEKPPAKGNLWQFLKDNFRKN